MIDGMNQKAPSSMRQKLQFTRMFATRCHTSGLFVLCQSAPVA